MYQVLRKGLKNIVVEQVPEPTVGQGEVKIKTAFSLISTGTEVSGLHPEGLAKEVIRERDQIRTLVGRAIREQGVVETSQAILDKFSELSITGYSGAGIVVAKSNEVVDLDIGEKVAYGGLQTGHAEIVCAPRNLVAAVPSGVNLREASLTTVGSIALHAVRNARISLGDCVGVVGLGLVGQLVVQLAKISGARVFGIDLKKERMKKAKEHGAELAIHASENPKRVMATLTGGQGLDSVIVCASSKDAQPLEMAIDLSRSRARIVVVGIVKMEIPWESVFLKELGLVVSRAYGPGSYDPAYEKKGLDYPIDYVRWTENRNMEEFMRLLRDKQIVLGGIMTHEFPMKEAPTVYEKMVSGAEDIIAAVLSYSDSGEDEEVIKTKGLIEISRRNDTVQADKLNVGLIGLGNIARWVHLPNVLKHPKLLLRGVCTLKGYKAKHFGIRFKSEYCCTDYKQILEDQNVHVVMICTRHNLHASMAIEALKAGKHVFLEKPMAMTLEECVDVVRLVRETGLGFAVNFNRRYSQMYQLAKIAISGKGPKLISIRMNSPDMSGTYWMMDPAEGGGAILGEGCHFFDLMAWFADSDPVSIFANNLELPEDKIGSNNNLASTIAFEDGSVGGFVYETLGHRNLGSERVEVSCGGTTALVEDVRRLWIWNGDGSRPKRRKRMKAEKGHYQLLDDFVEGVFDGRNFEKEALQGAKATLCAIAALRSLETGVPETIESL